MFLLLTYTIKKSKYLPAFLAVYLHFRISYKCQLKLKGTFSMLGTIYKNQYLITSKCLMNYKLHNPISHKTNITMFY